MPAVRSKICGITRIEDALAAVEAGADAIGFVFYAKSPRAVNVLQARAIIAALPPFMTTVGLFVNASRCELNETLDAVPLDMLQFHGDESPDECESYQRPYIKALRVKAGDDIAAACAAYTGARGILLDTYVEGVPGGTGEAFDADSRRLEQADHPRRWAQSRECRGGHRAGPALCGGRQRRSGAGQGHQGSPQDSRIHAGRAQQQWRDVTAGSLPPSITTTV